MTLLSPADLNKITQDAALAEAALAAKKKTVADQLANDLKRAFESRQIAPETPDRINAAVKVAAEQGLHEILVLRFPSSFCNDGGRSINNAEPEWPDSLEGFSKTAFQYFDRELRPLGFRMRALIMDFPNGFPGDVGLYLCW